VSHSVYVYLSVEVRVGEWVGRIGCVAFVLAQWLSFSRACFYLEDSALLGQQCSSYPCAPTGLFRCPAGCCAFLHNLQHSSAQVTEKKKTQNCTASYRCEDKLHTAPTKNIELLRSIESRRDTKMSRSSRRKLREGRKAATHEKQTNILLARGIDHSSSI
jgi:hypothetical protein